MYRMYDGIRLGSFLAICHVSACVCLASAHSLEECHVVMLAIPHVVHVLAEPITATSTKG